MRIKQFAYSILLSGVVAMSLTACNDNPETGGGPENIPEAVVSAFNSMYPGATNVSWSTDGDYAIASFYYNETRADGQNHAAWFTLSDARWGMTETDIPFDYLPEAVQTGFTESEYSKSPWKYDRMADCLQRLNAETIYVIDAEKQENGIETEVDLFYSEDGVLLKTIIDGEKSHDYSGYFPDTTPCSISEWIRANYPGARIVDIDREGLVTEVDIIDNHRLRELTFADNTWMQTKTEVLSSEVPEVVMNALRASDVYTRYPHISEITEYMTKDNGTFYGFELESRYDDDRDIFIRSDGTIIDKPTIGGNDFPGISAGNTIDKFIANNYPGAVIVGRDYDDGYIEVEIIHEQKKKELRFNGREEWLSTEWELHWSEVPDVVKDGLQDSLPGFHIERDDVEYIQTPKGNYYTIDVEFDGNNMTAIVDESGKVLRVFDD